MLKEAGGVNRGSRVAGGLARSKAIWEEGGERPKKETKLLFFGRGLGVTTAPME